MSRYAVDADPSKVSVKLDELLDDLSDEQCIETAVLRLSNPRVSVARAHYAEWRTHHEDDATEIIRSDLARLEDVEQLLQLG